MPSIQIINGLNMKQIGNTIDMSKGKSTGEIMDEIKKEIVKRPNPLCEKKVNVTLTIDEWESVLNFCDFTTDKPTHIINQIQKAIDEQTSKKEPEPVKDDPELFADAEEDKPVVNAVPVIDDICEECNKPIEITGMVSVCYFNNKKCCGPCVLNIMERKKNECIVNKKPPTPIQSDSSDEEEEDEIQKQIDLSKVWEQLILDLKDNGIIKASKSQLYALKRNIAKSHIYKIHTTKKSVIIRFFYDESKIVGKNIFPKQN